MVCDASAQGACSEHKSPTFSADPRCYRVARRPADAQCLNQFSHGTTPLYRERRAFVRPNPKQFNRFFTMIQHDHDEVMKTNTQPTLH